MKQYKVFVEMASNRYCHDIIDIEEDTPESKAISLQAAKETAQKILDMYKGEGVYCNVLIWDENFNIVFEKDNIPISDNENEPTTLSTILNKRKDNTYTNTCILYSKDTKDNYNKKIQIVLSLNKNGITIKYRTVIINCNDHNSIEYERITDSLDEAIAAFNLV